MPDWTYHTLLKPLLPRVPRRFLRIWGESWIGRALIRFFGHATSDDRLRGLADDDTNMIVSQLGVGSIVRTGSGHGEPAEAIEAVESQGYAILDIRRGGPGLPKRVREATHHGMTRAPRTGFWLLGLGMIAAGAAAAYVAATRVVLPYDTAYVTVPDHWLPFLAHDRMTLAGTMVSIGILYAALSWFAGATSWVRTAMIASGVAGFGSFFLFLAYGYFDPLHAAVSSLLLPLFIWGAWRPAPHDPGPAVPDTRNDRAWMQAQWGTLGMVSLGLGITIGGMVIAIVGSTSVFVPSDLAFIGETPTDTSLVALAAHDRAGFGGALVSNGILVMLTAMWGIRRGAAWLWWAYGTAGTVGLGTTIGVHYWVGYEDFWHLFPVYAASGLFIASMFALAPYMLCAAHQGRPAREHRPRVGSLRTKRTDDDRHQASGDPIRRRRSAECDIDRPCGRACLSRLSHSAPGA